MISFLMFLSLIKHFPAFMYDGYGYVGLCMPMYDYVWLCRVMYGYVGVYMPMYR